MLSLRRRNLPSDTVCLQEGLQVAVLDAVVSSGCLGSPQLALLDPLQDSVGLDGAEFRRLAGREVLRFVVGHWRHPEFMVFILRMNYNPSNAIFVIDISQCGSQNRERPQKGRTLRIEKDRTMRSIVAKLFIGMAITAIGMFGADSSLGTWKYNAAKSKTTSTNPIKSQTDVREATPDGGVKVTRTGQLADGTPVNYSFTYKYDGKEYPVTGATV